MAGGSEAGAEGGQRGKAAEVQRSWSLNHKLFARKRILWCDYQGLTSISGVVEVRSNARNFILAPKVVLESPLHRGT